MTTGDIIKERGVTLISCQKALEALYRICPDVRNDLIVLSALEPGRIHGSISIDSLYAHVIRKHLKRHQERIREIKSAIRRQLIKKRIDASPSVLNSRELQVLQLRFGLKDGRYRTLEEEGHELFVCGERIRQIENIALLKLWRPVIARLRKLLAGGGQPSTRKIF